MICTITEGGNPLWDCIFTRVYFRDIFSNKIKTLRGFQGNRGVYKRCSWSRWMGNREMR